MRAVVIGGGIAGLTAAYRLLAAGHEVVVLEGSDRAGGKLRTDTVGDVTLDVGAESILATRPEAVQLCRELGLDIVHPATTSAAIWTRGALRPLPRTVLGIPCDVDEAVASGIVEAVDQRVVPLPDADISIAEYVVERAGPDVLDRLVEPLLGGVYAGRADGLSLAAAGERLRVLGADPVGAAAAVAPAPGPVFAGLAGGVGTLATALADRLDVRVRTTVVALERDAGRWLVRSNRGDEPAGAVVVATPPPAAARLLAEVAPRSAYELADVELASVAIVTLVFDRELDLPGSGFLVPAIDARALKGATFSSNKWDWLRHDGRTVLRASLGRAGEAELLQGGDSELVQVVLSELAAALGGLPAPAATHVQRWGGGLPQYAVGHLGKVAAIDAEIAALPGLELCGAAYRGVGIVAVVAGAVRAAERLQV